MSLLPILRYPDPRLSRTAKPVTLFDERLKKLVEDMAETMYDAPGIGLAAPQVNVNQQIVVIDVSEDRNDLKVLINPEIVWTCTDKASFEEGCLSVPGIYDEIERPTQVRVKAQAVDGTAFEMEAEGLMAVVVQHEIDHLKGRVFVDYLSPLKRTRIKQRLIKDERERARERQRELRPDAPRVASGRRR